MNAADADPKANADTQAAPSAKPQTEAGKTQMATFGGGCFWCTEAVFERIDGVKNVVSGYEGGTKPNPSYQQVCSGDTGHAEVIRIEFDPAQVSYADLLDVFWQAHDPTTKNRQGPDEGTQYRSVIFYHDDAQKAAAEKSKKETSTQFKYPIVTEIVPHMTFYTAEEYHQDFFAKNPNNRYCQYNIPPKLLKLKKAGKLK